MHCAFLLKLASQRRDSSFEILVKNTLVKLEVTNSLLVCEILLQHNAVI